MFKHILLPTDGSNLSNQAVTQAVALAKSLGAKITAIHIVEAYHAFRFFEPFQFRAPVTASATNGLRNVPIPVISTSTTSPAFMFGEVPSVPIQITSPG